MLGRKLKTSLSLIINSKDIGAYKISQRGYVVKKKIPKPRKYQFLKREQKKSSMKETEK